jgi:hypothetical protein
VQPLAPKKKELKDSSGSPIQRITEEKGILTGKKKFKLSSIWDHHCACPLHNVTVTVQRGQAH